jgi:hypothetical protein
MVAAAIVDPLVEFASNAGWFGPGTFTDRSNLDVVPALALGTLFVGVQIVARIYRTGCGERCGPAFWRASDEALSGGIGRLLPAAFALQICALFAMETAEQFAVYGHGLGGIVWLGGPAAMSLGAHLVACVAVAYGIARLVRALARAAALVLNLLSSAPFGGATPPVATACRRGDAFTGTKSLRALRGSGERAPPSALPNCCISHFAFLGEPLCFLVPGCGSASLPVPA